MSAILIPTNRSDQPALVSPEDVALVAPHRWHIGGKGYAQANIRTADGRRSLVLMHRLILGAPAGLQVDHINHERLDNQRPNLRIATASQNNAARRTAGRLRGVHYHRTKRRWMAHITINQRQRHLGYFDTATEAARAYDDAALKAFGEFASLNNAPANEFSRAW